MQKLEISSKHCTHPRTRLHVVIVTNILIESIYCTEESLMLIHCLCVVFFFHLLLSPFTCYKSISNVNYRFSDTFPLTCSKIGMCDGQKKVVSTVEHVRDRMSDAAVSVSCLAALYLSDLALEPAMAATTPEVPTRGFQTKSGLKYFDAIVGAGAQPKYGN